MLRNQIDKIRLLFRKDRESYFCFYKILGFFPRNIRFYQQALLHKSTSVRSEKGRPLNNERLEFLGDAILDAILAKVKELYKNEEINDIDGVKIDFPAEWVHLRKSNTEPIIRVYTEAKSMDEADALAQRFIAEIKEICNI